MKKKVTTQEILSRLHDITELLTPSQQDELMAVIKVEQLKRNQLIYDQGDVPQYLICLISGKVKIYRDGVGGRSQIVRVIKPGEYFAYRAYFAGENYVTAAAAFEPAAICTIPIECLARWMQDNVPLAKLFIRMLSRDLGNSDQRIVSLTQKHIRGRLAEALLLLKENYGLEEDQATLSVHLSREDLANLSNMTTSNAIRTLSAFAQEKLILVDSRKISLLDEPALLRVSQNG